MREEKLESGVRDEIKILYHSLETNIIVVTKNELKTILNDSLKWIRDKIVTSSDGVNLSKLR